MRGILFARRLLVIFLDHQGCLTPASTIELCQSRDRHMILVSEYMYPCPRDELRDGGLR